MSFSRRGAKAQRFGSRRGAEGAEELRAEARFLLPPSLNEGLLTQPSEPSQRPLRLCANPFSFAPSRLSVNQFNSTLLQASR
jgi:hypothetical protein